MGKLPKQTVICGPILTTTRNANQEGQEGKQGVKEEKVDRVGTDSFQDAYKLQHTQLHID